MAIYHLSAQIISRSDGRSAVAAAAYRAGEELLDERIGQVHNFTKKQVHARHIMAPAAAPEWVFDRQKLWNAVEFAEKRKDAQLCREIEISLPKELSIGEQESLYKAYVQEQFVDRGMIADLGVHLKDTGNPHVHIMLTTREITPDGFGKKNREWNDKALLQSWREQWSTYANKALEKAGHEDRIDHRSFADQGITDRQPTIHEGPISRAMEKRGVRTERGDINRDIQEHNSNVLYLEKFRKEKESIERKLALHPNDRKVVTQAEKLTDQTANLQSIQKELAALEDRQKQFIKQEAQLKANLKPFELGDMYFANIAQWENSLRESNTIKGFFNRGERENKKFLEQRIAETKQKLYELGFKEPEKYEARKAKVVEYTKAQLRDIQQAKDQIANQLDSMTHAERVMKTQDIQKVRNLYPTWKGAEHLSYEDAKTLLDLNKEAGRVIQPEEVEQVYTKYRQDQNVASNTDPPETYEHSHNSFSHETEGPLGDPGLGMIKAAFEAAQRANRAAEQHEAEKEWLNRKRKKGRNGR